MPLIIEGIEFDNLLRARNKFESFRKHLDTEQEKAGAIQSFEYTFEITWKIMKRIIDKQGDARHIITGSRDVIRVAADHLRVIDQPRKWFDFLDARNITSHTYNEEDADAVIATFDDFSAELSKFLKKVGAI